MIKYFCDFCGKEINEYAYTTYKASYVLSEHMVTEYHLCWSCCYDVANLIENKRIEKQGVEE